MTKEKKAELTGLDLMRKKFDYNQISKLPKQAKWMTDKKDEYKNCNVCGGYHHPKAVHLDYVGHAALTDRLLDCDPNWSWEPISYDDKGLPFIDGFGGMWIKLTVCGVTRIGYGHPDGKKGGDAMKEVIGDSLRNAAMRFGAALDLWHKGDLHAIEDEPETKPKSEKKSESNKVEKKAEKKDPMLDLCGKVKEQLVASNTIEVLDFVWTGFQERLADVKRDKPAWYDALLKEYQKKFIELEGMKNA